MITPDLFYLSQTDWLKMQTEAHRLAPEEACGLLIGKAEENVYRAMKVIPITNIRHSPVRFSMDPGEQLKAFNEMEAENLELVGIYHSHPHGPERPSATDIAEAYYPEAIYLIWNNIENVWRCKGYLIRSSQVNEVPLKIYESGG